ncbi:MAG: DUF4349 domain-containing protein [Bacteroidota bacterium]
MKIIPFLSFILLLLFTSCQEYSSDQMKAYTAFEDYDQNDRPDFEDKKVDEVPEKMPRKLIRTGNVSFTVNHLDSAYVRIAHLVREQGAVISNESLRSYSGYRAYDITVRVKPEKFDLLVDKILDGSEELTNREVNTKDVSQRFYDLESRLKSKRAMESRYLQLLTKADKVEDMLKIEAQVAQLREDIEAMETSFRLLQNQIGLSTLHLYFTETQAMKKPGLLQKAGNNFSEGWSAFMNTLISLISIWPLILLLGALAIMFKRYRSRRRNGEI